MFTLFFALSACSTSGLYGAADTDPDDMSTGDTGDDTGFDDSSDTGFDDSGTEDTGWDDSGIEDTGWDDSGIEDTGWDDSGIEDTGWDDADDTGDEDMLDTGDEETGDTGFDVGPWIGQWGEVDQAGGESWTGFVDSDGTTTRCDLEYPLNGPSLANGCPGCSVAMTFTLGAPEIFANVGGRCDQLGVSELQGTTLTVGHQAPGNLMKQAGSSWSNVGWSEVDGNLWAFELLP